MLIKADTIEEYIKKIPEDRQEVFSRLIEIVKTNIPDGFKEVMSYNFPSFVVPHSIYPAGYLCKPEEPLPFISLASQKNFIALYHMGIYANPKLVEWFKIEYSKLNIGKLDMGKSCIRFKNMNKIPFNLLAELCSKMSVKEWIMLYEVSRGSH